MKPTAHVDQAVILVGGRGTRLGALTDQTPKPMLQVGGVPFLEYLLLQLKSHGIRKILLCVGYLAGAFQEYFSDGQRLGLQIDYSFEPEPAGTAGPLLLARPHLAETFFVLNGDTIFDVPLQSLAGELERHPAALGVAALRWVDDVSRYGAVKLDGNRIAKFDEKGGMGKGMINGGVYCLRKSVLDLLPDPPCSIEKTLFPWLVQRQQLLGLCFDSYFIDIGLPETLHQAGVELPQRLGGLKPTQNVV